MTYNVFGGTLNLAQSINHGSPVSTVYCISVHRIRHLQPSKSSSVAPTVAVSFNRQTNDCPAVHTHCRMLYLLLGCLIVRCRRCVCCRRVRYSIWSRFVLAHSTCIAAAECRLCGARTNVRVINAKDGYFLRGISCGILGCQRCRSVQSKVSFAVFGLYSIRRLFR